MRGGPLLSEACLTSEHIHTSLNHLSQRLMATSVKTGQKKGLCELHLAHQRPVNTF